MWIPPFLFIGPGVLILYVVFSIVFTYKIWLY